MMTASFLRLPFSQARLLLLVLISVFLSVLLPTRASLSAAAAPVLLSVSGCAVNNGQNTSGCHAGETISITGRGFISSPPPVPVVGTRACSPVTVLSNSSILCVLDRPLSDAQLNSQLPLRLLQGDTTSNAVYLSYAPPAPLVRSLSGCASNNLSWSWNCLGGASVLTVTGIGFVSPLDVALSNDFGSPHISYVCGNVTRLSDGNLTCSVPLVADTAFVLAVRVTSAGVTSPPFYGTTVNNRTQDGLPVIIGVTGCADGAASQCQIGDSVTIVGSQLAQDAVGYVSGRACQSSRQTHPSSVVCSLPVLDDYTAWQPVQVFAGGRFTNVLYLGVKFGLLLRLDSVFGCEGAARQCRPGDVVSVHGQGFVQSPLTALVNGVPCSQTVWISPQQLECALPDLGLSGQLLPLLVQSANMTSNPVYIAYNISQPAPPSNGSIPVSRVPVVLRLSGCATSNGSSTFGCVAGGLLSITGANFSLDAAVQLIGPYVFSACGNVSRVNMSYMTCTLPAVPAQAVGELLGVEVSSWTHRSSVFFGLTIGVRGSNSSTNTTAPPTPSVRWLQGCVQSGNSTLYCHAGQTLTVGGSNFSMPATVLLDGLYACQGVFLSANGQMLSCSIPLLPESAVGRLLSVTVICNNRSSAAFMGMSTLNSLTVTSVVALNGSCSRGANSVLFGCTAYDAVVVFGSGFGPGPLTVQLFIPSSSRLVPCGVSRLIDSTRVLCDLPPAPVMHELLSVLVYSGNIYSPSLPALLYGLPAPPAVTSVRGCGPYQQQSVGCHQGSLLTVTGLSFFDPLTVQLTGARSNNSYVCGNTQLDFASSTLTCTVPQVDRVDNNASLLLTVRSVGGNSAASPSVSITTLGNLTISVTAVRGCDASSNSVAFNCYANETVTVTGSGFTSGGQRLSVLVGGLNCTRIYVLNDSALSCQLPQLNGSALLGRWLLVEVLTPTDASNPLAAVSYNPAVPAIFSVSGCPRNGTSDCAPGAWLTVAGANLLNVSSVFVEQLPCAQMLGWAQMLSCQLPALSPSYLNRWLSLWVEISGGRTALVLPAAIRYAPLVSSSTAATARSSGLPAWSSSAPFSSSGLPPTLPSSAPVVPPTSAPHLLLSSSSSAPLGPLSVESVSGCAVDSLGGTSGCVAHQLISIVGTGFSTSPMPVVSIQGGYYNFVCQVQDSTRMRCELPDIDPSLSNQWQPVSVVLNLSRQRAVSYPGVRYAAISPASTGSAGFVSGRLSYDELVLIVVVVAVVVALLCVLQLLWCLSRCCGVVLPCCSRLCPAARQSDDAHPEQEIHLGLLPNDQLVVHRQSPIPQAAVAIAYEQPQQQQQQQHQPRMLLLPRSFVPSPEYYQ